MFTHYPGAIHGRLSRRFSWYRAWHQVPYINIVHYIFVLSFSAVDFYLAYLLKQAIQQL
jgi:hypothetical protein